MRYIELKTVPSGAIRGFTDKGEPVAHPDVSFAEHIKNMCQFDPNGMNVAGVRSAMRILNAIDAQAGSTHLALEDSDYNYLRQRLEKTNFTVASSGVEALIDAIEGAGSEAPVVAPAAEETVEAPVGETAASAPAAADEDGKKKTQRRV